MKDYYIPDVAIQRFVLEGSGFSVIPCLMHLNREYIYDGRTHDLSKLFTIEDVTAETDNLINGVPAEVRAQLQMLTRDTAPEIEPGPQCSSPFRCEFFDVCNKPIPGDHVSRLPRIAESKLLRLADLGVSSIRDIPPGFPLTEMQTACLGVGCERQGVVQQGAREDAERAEVSPLFHGLRDVRAWRSRGLRG